MGAWGGSSSDRGEPFGAHRGGLLFLLTNNG